MAAGEMAATDSWPVADSPVAAVRRLFRAYSGRSVESYAALLSADFRFFSSDSEFIAAYPAGFTRGDEIASAEHLFHGFINRAGEHLPAASTINVVTDTLWAMADPERPDSAAWCQVVVAKSVLLSVSLEGGGGFASPLSRHEFHVVRADAAARAPGEPADPGRWLVRLWVENPAVPLLATAARPAAKTPAASPADSARTPVPGALPRRMAILRLPNPARGQVRLRIALAERGDARIEVFDVQGRCVAGRDLGERDPGEYEVLAADGAALATGSYWIRMIQGRSSITRHIVVLR